jgi:DNA-binding response OmpR family regulator
MTNQHVLIVEDSQGLAEMYQEWIGDEYTVTVAPDGETATEVFDETVDVVLLDRRLPGRSGDDVLHALRERSDCPIAMVTAVDPDFDILELGIDDYIIKPIDREELVSTVQRLISRSEYVDQLREYFALVSKRTVIAEHKTYAELDREEYRELEREIDELEQQLADSLARLEPQDFDVLFREIGADNSGSGSSTSEPPAH